MFLRFVFAVSLLLNSTAAGQAAPVMVPTRPPAVRPVTTEPYFPAPGATPTGAGLPGERVPGASAPAVPRSEGRMLPRTKEPGLWAADAVEASGSKADKLAVLVAGVEIPSRFNKSDAALRTCGAVVSDALGSERGTPLIASLPEPTRTCTAYRLVIECLANGGRYEQARLRKGREASRSVALGYFNALEFLKWKRDGLCTGVNAADEIEDLILSVNRRVKTVVDPRPRRGFQMVTIDETEGSGNDEE